MKKAIIALVVLALAGGGAYWYYKYGKKVPEPTVMTAAVTRGDISDTVGATGTLQAVTTVQVGTQVSGTIQELHADFNSLVKKDQVIARLDPSLFATQIEQGQANLIRAQADLERLKVSLDDAHMKLNRARELAGRQLIPQSELDTAEVNTRSIDAQIRSSQAQVTQAQASLNQNQVNLEHTVIRAPIDGLVISRNVDVGQTVAASMQAPTLFILAADLTKMQVIANLDESDVGRIRPGAACAIPRRRLPDRGFRRRRGAGAPPADRPAERRHLRDRHRRAEPGAQVEARDDGQRHRRDRQAHRRHQNSQRRSAVPSDARDIRSSQAHSAAWPARVGRRRAGTRWTGRTGCPRGTGCSRCSGFTRCSGCSRCARCAGGRTSQRCAEREKR